MNVVTKRKVKYSYEKVFIVDFLHSQHFVIFSVQEKSSSYMETMELSWSQLSKEGEQLGQMGVAATPKWKGGDLLDA